MLWLLHLANFTLELRVPGFTRWTVDAGQQPAYLNFAHND